MPFFLNPGTGRSFSLWTLYEQKHRAATLGRADQANQTQGETFHITDISAGGSGCTVMLQVSFCYKQLFKQLIFPPLLRKTLGKTFFLTLSPNSGMLCII